MVKIRDIPNVMNVSLFLGRHNRNMILLALEDRFAKIDLTLNKKKCELSKNSLWIFLLHRCFS